MFTYVARTNWHAAYVSLQKQADVSKADATSFREEMDRVKGEKAKLEEESSKYKAAAEKEKQDLNAQLKAREEILKTQKEETARHVAAESAAGEELKRRTSEVEYLKGLVATRDTQLAKLEKQRLNMREAMVDAQINFDQEHARNERLLQENERLGRDNRHIQQVASSTSLRREAPKKNPPVEDVAGSVKKTDPSGYVTLSVGSDAGLSKGNTLEVYRLKPEPYYLGMIQVLDARPNEAVARPIDRVRGVIQVGDKVSSNIMGQR
jgi:hypothetical protein